MGHGINKHRCTNEHGSILFGAIAGTLAFTLGALFAEEPSPQDVVRNAADALADKSTYSWTTTVSDSNAYRGCGPYGAGFMQGKTQRGGFTTLSVTSGGDAIQVVLNGDKGVINVLGSWQPVAEVVQSNDGRQGPLRRAARVLQRFKAPAVECHRLAMQARALTKTDNVYAGELIEVAAQQLLTSGLRPGGTTADSSNARGFVRFVVKDGLLSSYEYSVQGSIRSSGNDININRTTTVEIKDVDTTRVDVPEEAKQKLQ